MLIGVYSPNERPHNYDEVFCRVEGKPGHYYRGTVGEIISLPSPGPNGDRLFFCVNRPDMKGSVFCPESLFCGFVRDGVCREYVVVARAGGRLVLRTGTAASIASYLAENRSGLARFDFFQIFKVREPKDSGFGWHLADFIQVGYEVVEDGDRILGLVGGIYAGHEFTVINTSDTGHDFLEVVGGLESVS